MKLEDPVWCVYEWRGHAIISIGLGILIDVLGHCDAEWFAYGLFS